MELSNRKETASEQDGIGEQIGREFWTIERMLGSVQPTSRKQGRTMSKRDQNRNQEEVIDQQPEETSPADILPDEGSNMGKEIKISLGVILVLLVVFGAVLYFRLSGPPSATAKSEKPTPAAEKPAVASLSAPAPAVVTATAGANNRSKLSVSDMAKWNAVGSTDTGEATAGDSQIPAAPASFMPRTTPAGETSSSDPFRKSATSQPSSYPEAAGQPNSGLQKLASDGPSSPIKDIQSGSGETLAAQPNPLRDQPESSGGSSSETAREPAGNYRYSNSSSSLQATTVPSSVQTATATPVAESPRPTFRSTMEPTNSYATPSPVPYGSPTPLPSAGSADLGTAYSAPPTSSQPLAQDNVPPGKYVIQPNDSYWTISEQLYGTGAYFQALAEHNRKKVRDENRLRAGDLIATPTVAELEKSFPSLCPKPAHRESAKRNLNMVSTPARMGGKVYTVQEGDTLFDIARFELGKASRWAEIYEMNRDLLGSDFDHLTPGMQLALPQDQPAGTVTQRPSEVYQR
jgi:nucleoid-associated protein YgaU